MRPVSQGFAHDVFAAADRRSNAPKSVRVISIAAITRATSYAGNWVTG